MANCSERRIRVVANHLKGGPKLHLNRAAATSYRFSLGENGQLSRRERDFYEENGFIIIPNLIPHDILDECARHFVDICEGKFPRGAMTVMKDKSLMQTAASGEYLYNKVQDFLFDEVFAKYFTHPRLLDYVEAFIGPNIRGMHSMLINKPPDSGKLTSIHPLHQDLHYFPFRPAEKIVASWTAMEKVYVDNGCLFALPGTHKTRLEPHDYPGTDVNKAYHGVKGFDDVEKVFLPMEKGDTAFFHPLLIHGSGPNLTKGFRKAISVHFASTDCKYIDLKGTTQENIQREIEEVSRKKGLELDFTDIWRYKSRMLRGEPGNL